MTPAHRDCGLLWFDECFLTDSLPLYERLVNEIIWDSRIKARKVASFGVPYNYSGTVWPASPIPDMLADVLDRVASRVGFRPNNCLANYYPDGTSTMGFHRNAIQLRRKP